MGWDEDFDSNEPWRMGFQPTEEELAERTARAAEVEREFAAKLAPLAARAKALQRAEFTADAVKALQELEREGRPDFSPEFQALWKIGVRQSINRLEAMTNTKDNGC